MKGHLTIVGFHELLSALERERTYWSFQTLGFAKHEAQNSPYSVCRHLDARHHSQHFHFHPGYIHDGSHKEVPRSYTIFVVSYAVFVDILLYGVIVPVIPLALQQRIGVPF